jgi:hypothetical protein
MGGDKSHATHVSCQCINGINIASDFPAIVPSAQVHDLKLVGACRTKLGIFEIGSPNPKAFLFKKGYEMMTDKAASASYKNLQMTRCHGFLLEIGSGPAPQIGSGMLVYRTLVTLCGSNPSYYRSDRTQQDDAVQGDALVFDIREVIVEILVNGHGARRANLP